VILANLGSSGLNVKKLRMKSRITRMKTIENNNSDFSRSYGTFACCFFQYPTINRWAIIMSSYGTESFHNVLSKVSAIRTFLQIREIRPIV